MSRYEPTNLSYSQLSTYLQCGKQFELERVAKVPRGSAWYFVGGSSVHSLTEEYDRLFFSGKLTVHELLEEGAPRIEMDFIRTLQSEMDEEAEKSGIPHTEWDVSGKTKKLPAGKDYEWWSVEGPLMVTRWLEWRRDSGYQMWDHEGTPGIELPLKVTLHNAPALKAYPDRVMVSPSGELVVLDVKTGVKDPDNMLQLGIYAVAMEKAGYPRPSYGTHWMALRGEHTTPSLLNHYTVDVVDRLFEQFYAGTQAELYLPNLSDRCRYMCRVSDFCHMYGGARSAEYDPLDPNYKGAA